MEFLRIWRVFFVSKSSLIVDGTQILRFYLLLICAGFRFLSYENECPSPDSSENPPGAGPDSYRKATGDCSG